MPFITPPSPYLILGSNIIGGAPNLIVNNGINNMALGNFVLTNNNNGDNNIAIGNLAMNAHLNGESNLAIGFAALSLTELNQENVVLGAFAGNASNPYFDSVIIGVGAGGFSQQLNDGSTENVIIGHNAMFGSDETPLDLLSSNVIIGAKAMRQELGVSPDLSVVSNIILGANVLSEVNSNVGTNVVIGGEALTNLNQNVESNIVIGYNAASDNDGNLLADADFISNILIGTEVALKLDDSGAGTYTLQEQIAIGNRAMAGMVSIDPNIVLGTNSLIGYLPSDNAIYSTDARARNNVIIGNQSAQINSELAGGEQIYQANIIVGNGSFNCETSDGNSKNSLNNIVIGNNTIAYSDNIVYENVLLIGNNIETVDSNTIIIGDPNATYTTVLVGGIDLLNISGGLSPTATQTADDLVSITSTANDGVSTYSGAYVLNANSDNTTNANSTFNLEASGDDGQPFTSSMAFNTGAAAGFATTEFILTSSGDGGINAGATFLAVTDNSTGDRTAALVLNGQEGVTISLNTNLFALQVPATTGAETPSFVATNAPEAALEITNYIQVTLNGVAGYIPFLSV